MLIEIPAYVEQIIKQQAQEQGITAEQLAEQTLTKTFSKETPFNFDLEEMDKALNGKFVEMPKGMANNQEDFDKWLAGAFS